MKVSASLCQQIEDDIWGWIKQFVMAPNEFYHYRFPPCPFARGAVNANAVDVRVWQSGNVREFIQDGAVQMRECPSLSTRIMTFPPNTEFRWGLSEYVESLNTELVATDVFLNTGLAKTTCSRYPGPSTDPYFVVIANSMAAVLAGAKSLMKTPYYQDWPTAHYGLVVERRERMARKYGLE